MPIDKKGKFRPLTPETQPISVVSLPLPAGASTEAKQDEMIGNYTSRIYTAGGYTYIAEATPGSLTSSAVWRISRIDSSGNELYADPIASAAFEGITRRLDLIFTLVHFNPINGKEGSTEAGWRLNLAADGKWYPGKYSYEWLGIGVKIPQDIPYETEFLRFFTHHTDVPPIP